MRTVGIICEYNPFHMGHKMQIDILRSMGYDCIVGIMSGNYTQRGEFSLFDKYTRAEASIYDGADLILELPFPYSSLSAEGFANAGIYILGAMGIDAVSFGTECGNIDTLQSAAHAVLTPEFQQVYSDIQKSCSGSAAAYFEAIKKISGSESLLLSNDILGISYLAAIKKMKLNISPIPIKRTGNAYNEKLLINNVLPSASAIREALNKETADISDILAGHVPESVISCLSKAKSMGMAPVLWKNIGNEILSFFKIMTPTEIIARAVSRSGGGEHIAEDGCGICERICNVAKASKNFDEFLANSYTSKYPNARINRVMIFSIIGISDAASHSLPEYTTVLASNNIGRQFLSTSRKTREFKVITKPADAPIESIQRKISEAADSFYTSAIPSQVNDDFFIKAHPFILK